MSDININLPSFIFELDSTLSAMSSALEKFNRRDELARFSLESQKLSQYIQNLNENQYAQQRWIWELIQNAKDVGNEFEKISIKIVIEDSRLVFSHNGYPFSPEQLNSIISQYSLKQEQNSQDVETTGKYGTGFISTHILSRVIRVQGKLKVIPDDVSEIQLSQSEVEGKIPLEKKSMRKEEVKKQKVEARQRDDGYYQNFNIVLDRSYKSRDQLAKKLMRTKKEIEKELQRNDKKQPIYVRNQQDFDTSFIYENLDKASFLVIEKGLQSLQKLFPSVLLFNPKLYQIQVINKSSYKKIEGFKITRQESNIKINMLNTFSVNVQGINAQDSKDIKDSLKKAKKVQKAQKNKVVSFAYLQDPESKSLIAVPIEITPNRMVKLLKLQKNHPKIYKEFPLIGSEDTHFNFIFTSREFYPNETRTQLLLKSIQNRPSAKSQQNWKTLLSIFDNINDLYLLMNKYIVSGKMNLFLMKKNNCFSQFKERKIENKYLVLQTSVNDFAIFNTKAGKKSKLKDVTLIYQKLDKKIKENESSEILLKMNQLFSFLYANNTLQDQEYLQFIQYIQQNTHQLFKLTTLNQCLTKLQNYKFRNTEQCMAYLGNIYQFLTQNPVFHYYIYSSFYKIVLTQNLEMQSYQQPASMIEKSQLKIEKSQPNRLLIKREYHSRQEYESIANHLVIQYKNGLIHQRFSKYFQKKPCKTKQKQQNHYFGLQEMIAKFSVYFAIINDFEMLLKLGKFLKTFANTPKESFLLAKEINKLQGIQNPYPISVKTTMQQKYFNQFSQQFSERFASLMLQKYNSSNNLTQFMKHFNESHNKKQKAIQLINFLLRESKNIYYVKLLAWNQSIVSYSTLATLKQGHNYLTQEDIRMHETFFPKYKPYMMYGSKSLKESLVHPLLLPPQWFSQTLLSSSFNQQFLFLINYYNDQRSTNEDKHQILSYFCKIYESYIKNEDKTLKNKYDTFEQIIKVRYLEYTKLLSTLTDKQKDFICKIIRKRQDFDDLELLMKENLKEVIALLREKKRQELAAEATEKKKKNQKHK